MKGTNSAFNSASSIQPRVKHTFCYGCISPHADGCISPHAEAAPYMLDKNTPWRNVLSVLAFCFFLFLFSIRRVTLFFSIFIFLQSRLQLEKNYLYHVRFSRQFWIFYRNRNRFIRTSKRECFGILDKIKKFYYLYL